LSAWSAIAARSLAIVAKAWSASSELAPTLATSEGVRWRKGNARPSSSSPSSTQR
jgi:hypothetical protein